MIFICEGYIDLWTLLSGTSLPDHAYLVRTKSRIYKHFYAMNKFKKKSLWDYKLEAFEVLETGVTGTSIWECSHLQVHAHNPHCKHNMCQHFGTRQHTLVLDSRKSPHRAGNQICTCCLLRISPCYLNSVDYWWSLIEFWMHDWIIRGYNLQGCNKINTFVLLCPHKQNT